MSTQEQARKLIAQGRQHTEQVQERMLSRASEEVETHTEGDTEEKARELIAQERQQAEHLQENMLSRAAEQIE